MIARLRTSPTLRWGIILGLVASAVGIIQGLLPFFAFNLASDRAVTYGALLVYLALYFLAGLLVARTGGATSASAIAGMLVGVLSQAIAGCVLLGVAIANPLSYARAIGEVAYAKSPGALAVTLVMGLVIALGVYGTFGAAMGALGNLVLPTAGRSPANESARSRSS
jgi:hypothetical protein